MCVYKLKSKSSQLCAQWGPHACSRAGTRDCQACHNAHVLCALQSTFIYDKKTHPSASVTSATVNPLMGGHSWDPLHCRGAPENAKWDTGVHNAICDVPPLSPPHSVAFFCAIRPVYAM